MKPVIQTAYITGWWIQSELLTRQRRHVDLDGGWLILEIGEGKTQQARQFPLTPELHAILTEQVERTKALERSMGQIIPYLFHRASGKPILS